jgi:hypothetical protein
MTRFEATASVLNASHVRHSPFGRRRERAIKSTERTLCIEQIHTTSMATALEPEHDVTHFTDIPQYLQCHVAHRHHASLRFTSLQLLNYVRLHDPYTIFWLRRLLAVALPVAI